MPENIENKEVASKRDLLLNRLKAKHPDREYGNDDELYDTILNDYDNYDNRIQKQDEIDKNMADLFENNPQFAGMFLTVLSDKEKNPVIAMIEAYGDDFRMYLEDPENAEKLAEANKKYMERVGKEKELEEIYQSNIEKSLQIAEQVQKEGGYTDEQIDEAFKQIIDDAQKAILGEITKEMLETKLKGLTHDEDVMEAANQAEVKAKNIKIEEKKKNMKEELPMIEGKQASQTKKPENPTIQRLDSLVKKKNIWEGLKRY